MHPDQVKALREGTLTIETWRSAHPGSPLDLSGADLSGADLSGTDLTEAILVNADLGGSILFQANFIGADLTAANLSQADLSEAKFLQAQLREANLSESKMVSTNLFDANLFGANLAGADLKNADLFGCQLVRASLVGADLTGVKLYGAARDDWNIEGVKCRYVFWDREGKERSPRDRDLEPGEFERLYAQLPTIDYVFENGMTPLDPLVMDRIVQAINEQNPEFNLQIDSINARGIYPTIKFTVRQEEQKAAALDAVTRRSEIEHAKLLGQNQVLTDLIYRMIDRPPANINAGVAALYGSTINVQEYIGHLEEIEQVIKDAPAETLAEAAKREALDTVSGAFKDIARGKVKEAAETV